MVLTTKVGGLLVPELRHVASKPGAKIADVATGNAIWAVFAATEYPNAQVAGLDISDQQFPPAWTLPRNLSLGLGNVLEPIPEDLASTFDIVNARLLSAGLKEKEDFETAIAYFAGLLKPGGLLQWHELTFPTWQVIDESLVEDGSKFPRFVEIVYPLFGRSRRSLDLRSLVEADTSFTNVVEVEPPLVTWLIEYESIVGIKAFLEVLQMARKAFASSAEKIALLNESQQALDEYLRSGGMITMKMKLITARKK